MNSTFSFDATEALFQELVLEASNIQPVLVDFWATWCQPCQTLKPLLEKLADDYQGKFLLAKVDTEIEKNLANTFNIRSIPAVKLFINGEVVDEFNGALSEVELKKFLEKHISRDSDVFITQAEELFSKGNAEEALELVKKANQIDPGNSRALIVYVLICAAMENFDEAKTVIESMSEENQANPQIVKVKAQIKFHSISKNSETAEKLQEKLDKNPEDSQARYKLAALLMIKGQIETALDNLLILIQKDKDYDNGAGRKMIFDIFETLGNDPLVGIYRRKMMSLFY